MPKTDPSSILCPPTSDLPNRLPRRNLGEGGTNDKRPTTNDYFVFAFAFFSGIGGGYAMPSCSRYDLYFVGS